MTKFFNILLGEHRVKIYLCLVEHIRRWSSELPPTVNAKIVKASREGRLLKMLSAGNREYELLGETKAYVTKLNQFNSECEV
ncbi:hypothetical protein ACOSP7_020864 [Xanthoceras sorbifolium]